MNATHIAFINFPHPPHINPALPVVSTLAKRGHRVSFVTSERFAAAVEETGAEVVVIPDLDMTADRQDESPGPFRPYARKMLEVIATLYDQHRPDLIVYDFMAYAGRILAHRWGILAIQSSPFYAFSESDFDAQVKHGALRNALVIHANQIAEFYRGYGIHSANYRVDKEKLNLYLFPRVLQPNADRLGSNCFFAGRCPGERRVKLRWQDHSAGRPIALISVSTLYSASRLAPPMPEHFKMSIDALSSLGWHVVLSVPRGCSIDSLQPLPLQCEVIDPGAFLAVLPHANLLVFNSGTVTTSEAAYYGVPLIAITDGNSEFEWQGDRIAEVGIGVHISKPSTTTDNIRNAALRITTDKTLQRKVQDIKRAVRSEPGAEETANKIEEFYEIGLAAPSA